MKAPLQIDVISDVVCPWCIIGYIRMEQALAELDGKFEVSWRWHAFELNPQMPRGGQNLREHLAQKYGTTQEGSIAARDKLTALGHDLGFHFDYFDEMRVLNTFQAHQLLEWAHEHGKQTALKLRLFAAFFSERKAIDEPEVLVREAASVGLDEDEARVVLESGRFASIVREEESRWQQSGVSAVPTFILNGKYAIQGAQDTAHLVTQLKSMLTAVANP